MRKLLVTVIAVLACVLQLSGAQLWVGEPFSCSISYLGVFQTNIKWTTSGGYINLTGTNGNKTATITKYFSGSATIKCTYQYKLTSTSSLQTASKTWTVSCISNPLSIFPTTMNLSVGEQEYLGASLTYTNSYSSGAQIQFSSADSRIVTVNSSGLVTAVASGSTHINVYSNVSGNSCYCTITVSGSGSSTQPTAVSIPSSLSLNVRSNATLTPTLTPSNATTTYTWHTSNSSVATVSSSGVVTGVSSGTANIYCKTANNKTSNNCNVTVQNGGGSGGGSGPLCFTARNGSVTVQFSFRSGHSLQYSTNGTSWNTYTSNTPVTISANQSIFFRAETDQTTPSSFGDLSENSSSRFYFSSTNSGTIEGGGNIMSLYGPSCPNLTLPRYAFAFMFKKCTLLTKAPSLPATTLAKRSYYWMFNECTSLTTPPALPATNLAERCYGGMFNECTSLTNPPALPATTLAYCCYQDMFYNCTSLTTPPSLPATTLAVACYHGMFYGCSSLVTSPALPITNLAESCYWGMFCGCTSLTTPPSLPATTMEKNCYGGMFYGCTSLTTAPILPATTMAEGCYINMFNGCASLTTPPALPATTLAEGCYENMFEYCRSLTTPPALPASTLEERCYKNMFYCCNSMFVNTSAPGVTWIIPATTTAIDALTDMFMYTNGTMNGTPSVNTTYYISDGRHTVSVNANNSSMGYVSGGGTYFHGQTATLTATPYSGYHFVNWSNGQTTSTINVTVNSNMTLTANFAQDQQQTHTVTVTSNDPSMGSVSGGGTYTHGQTATLTATAYSGYHFVNWSNGQTTPTINVTVNSNMTLTANFAQDQQQTHTVTVTSNDPSMGSVSGGGTYTHGQMATLTATAYSGCHFVNWSNGQTTSTINVTVNSDMTLTAYFDNAQYQVSVQKNVDNRGTVTVSGNGYCGYGETVTLTATPNQGYEFVCWNNGVTSNVMNVVVVSDTTFTANFLSVTTDVENTVEPEYIAYSLEKSIVVRGVSDKSVHVYDMSGKMLGFEEKASDDVMFEVPVSGVYLIKIDDGTTIRVVVK